jgi:hypothetical protein
MKKLPDLIFALIMGCLMSLSITFAVTLVRFGLTEKFLRVWLEVWLIAYPVAIVCILIYKPLASKITAKILAALDMKKLK